MIQCGGRRSRREFASAIALVSYLLWDRAPSRYSWDCLELKECTGNEKILTFYGVNHLVKFGSQQNIQYPAEALLFAKSWKTGR